jgi:small redox-active disulfide protein 2
VKLTPLPIRRPFERNQNVNIKVLGTGCAKCKKLYAEAEKAIAASGKTVELEKVEKLDEIMKYGVMVTPALVIDEEVKTAGRLPNATEIAGWIAAAATKEAP